MGKYKIYFTEPKVTLPQGEWRGWLPDIIINQMSKISILFDIIGIGLIIFPFIFMNSNRELTAWMMLLTERIENVILRVGLCLIIAFIAYGIILIVHEILHLLITVGKGDLYIYESEIGISPYSDCVLSWGQSVIYKILPFLILSVSFFIIAMFMNSIFGSLLRFIAVVNLGMSIADIVLTPFMFLLLRNAVFYGGYWKMGERTK